MKYFDAHTHVQFVSYGDEQGAVMERARDAGVGMNLVGTQYETSLEAVQMAEKYADVWATIGLHPTHTSHSSPDTNELGVLADEFTKHGEIFDAAQYKQLAQSSKVIAIGECGLDYFRLESDTKKLQQDIFIQQIEMANELNKPLMLHIRSTPKAADTYTDALEILRTHTKVLGDVHFFAGDWEVAKRFLDIGFTLSFTGVITFTHDYDEVIRNTPLDMILSETDAPYVTPTPFRGKRNEPFYIPHIVKKIANIRGQDEELVTTQLRSNITRLFGV